MSSAQTQLAVAPNASSNLIASPPSQMQKDYLDETTLSRQNSLASRGGRGNLKGKHLTRSHAMRESTSPPRTPTPRADQHNLGNNNNNNNNSNPEQPNTNESKMQVQSSTSLSTSPSMDTQPPPVIVTTTTSSQPMNNHHNNSSGLLYSDGNDVICNDADFPKLSPPKSSKNNRNSNAAANRDINSNSNDQNNKKSPARDNSKTNGNNNAHNNDNNKERQHDSQTLTVSNAQSSPSSCDKENRYPRNDSQNSNASFSPDENQNSMADSMNDRGDRMGKKHRVGPNSKGSKPRLKTMGSSSSMDGGGNCTSGFISRDSSTEQFTDQNGVDLLLFFKETLNKNQKDRGMLMKIEKDLLDLVHDKSRTEIRFPAMTSYKRMLIHRVAAFFGMEHNVDTQTQQCVIVGVTSSTRIPDVAFKSLCREHLTEEPPRKSILKRDTHSFDDPRPSYLCPDRGVLDRKAKSFEEREEEYERARRRIFRGRDHGEMAEEHYWNWSSTESSEQSSKMRQNKLLKVQSLESRQDGRPSVSKSHSFGGYGGPPQSGGPLSRGDSVNSTRSAGPRLFSKQDSVGSTNYRLSPSSSGSIYYFDPSNLPPNQSMGNGAYNKQRQTSHNQRKRFDEQRNVRGNPSVNSEEGESSGTPPVAATTTADATVECSIESLAECSVQTVVVPCNTVSEEDEAKDKREMDDIIEEPTHSVIEDNPKLEVKVQEQIDTYQEKPRLINQATSPRVPSPEPEEPQQQEKTTFVVPSEINDEKTIATVVHSTSSTPTSSSSVVKKDEVKSMSNIPIMNFAHGYQTIDGTTVFPQPGSGTYPAYQQAPDGSLYAVPQSMVYAYPQSVEGGEVQGYFMPYYDPSHPRDAPGLIPTAAPPIYQPAGGPAVVPVASYSSGPFAGAPMYQGQVMYSSEQFAPGASTTAVAPGQVPQYPLATYPIGYPYPYNGYWGQTMYYVPQPSTVPQSILSAAPAPLPTGQVTGGAASTPNNHISVNSTTGNGSNGNSSSNSSGNPNTNRKRSTPPQTSSGHSSQTATPSNTTYQFAPGVPLALASDLNGPTMYAIPQPAVFSTNMLPYNHHHHPQSAPNAAAAQPPVTAGVITTSLPQSNTVISPLMSHHSASNGPAVSLETSGQTSYNRNNGGTPQSAPSTPLSNPVAFAHNQRNPPLFATPPIIANGYNPQMAQMHNHYQSNNSNSNSDSQYTSSYYEKKNQSNGQASGGLAGKKGNSGYIPNGRQNSYNGSQSTNTRKPEHYSGGGNMNMNSANRPTHISQQQKTMLRNDKPMNSSTPVSSSGQTSDKSRPPGFRQKPANLDFRKNGSQRNSPSTNSVESSNNSPNSIVSNHMSGGGGFSEYPQSYVPRGSHIPSMHPQAAASVLAAAQAGEAAANACHQPLIGAYNHPNPAAGMYIKYGQAYFTHPTVALPSNRRSPPSDIRPSMAPLTGVYPTMMIPAPRQMPPRHPNPNYKGTKPR